jgi:hypothetical protein
MHYIRRKPSYPTTQRKLAWPGLRVPTKLPITASSMGKASAGATKPYTKYGVRVVVAGDQGTGKSSLIVTATSENFPNNVPPVLPLTRFPEDIFPDRVPITIIDTSSGYALFGYVESVGKEKKGKV